jgi:hypothetical protein
MRGNTQSNGAFVVKPKNFVDEDKRLADVLKEMEVLKQSQQQSQQESGMESGSGPKEVIKDLKSCLKGMFDEAERLVGIKMEPSGEEEEDVCAAEIVAADADADEDLNGTVGLFQKLDPFSGGEKTTGDSVKQEPETESVPSSTMVRLSSSSSSTSSSFSSSSVSSVDTISTQGPNLLVLYQHPLFHHIRIKDSASPILKNFLNAIPTKKEHVCPVCVIAKIYQTPNGLKYHMRHTHPELQVSAKKKGKSKKNGPVVSVRGAQGSAGRRSERGVVDLN